MSPFITITSCLLLIAPSVFAMPQYSAQDDDTFSGSFSGSIGQDQPETEAEAGDNSRLLALHVGISIAVICALVILLSGCILYSRRRTARKSRPYEKRVGSTEPPAYDIAEADAQLPQYTAKPTGGDIVLSAETNQTISQPLPAVVHAPALVRRTTFVDN